MDGGGRGGARPELDAQGAGDGALVGSGGDEAARALGRRLFPLTLRGNASVARVATHWYIAATSRELRQKPIARTLLDMPLVLFRDGDGTAGALLDRCPHRNVPLSLGRVAGGRLECAYHGWQFDADGACRHVPSLASPSESKGRRAPALPTIEQDGFVWVYATPGPMPEIRPHRFALLGQPGYTVARQVVEARASLFSTLENALDVPHTAFLHRGLFRNESRGITIRALVERSADRVVAEYVGEPRPTGLVARILSPSGGMVTHFDRFIMPSIAQVEYRIGTENHFFVDAVMTPISDFVTRIYAVVAFRLRIPGWLVRPFLKPLAMRVFNQDARILVRQTETIERFGGEQFVSTDIDVLGRHIWRLLRSAERGEPASPERHEVELVV